MTRCFALLSVLVLAACTATPPPLPPPDVQVRPVTARDNLKGRWVIAQVDGRGVEGLWLELGGEGLATSGGQARAPTAPSRAYLGCNTWYLQGWTRNGDKLMLGTQGSSMTEIGCETARMATETRVAAILGEAATMELTPPSRLRLINGLGTLDLVRPGG